MGARKYINWDAQPLGQVGDSALARLLGCTPRAIARARYNRGIPAATVAYQQRRVVLRPVTEGPSVPGVETDQRAAAWEAAPATSDACRCCLDNPVGLGAARRHPRRWTDQGAICRAHYLALPACGQCGVHAVSNAGEWCEACCQRYQRAVGEATGWRHGEDINGPASLARGAIIEVKAGLRRFEARSGKTMETRG